MINCIEYADSTSEYTFTPQRHYYNGLADALEKGSIFNFELPTSIAEAKSILELIDNGMDIADSLYTHEFYNFCMACALYVKQRRVARVNHKDMTSHDLEDFISNVYTTSLAMFSANIDDLDTENLAYYTCINGYLIYDNMTYASHRKNISIDDEMRLVHTEKDEKGSIISKLISIDSLNKDLEEYRRKEEEKSNKALARLQGFSMEAIEKTKAVLNAQEAETLLTLLTLKASDVVLNGAQRATLHRLKMKVQKSQLEINQEKRLSAKQAREAIKAKAEADKEASKAQRAQRAKIVKASKEEKAKVNLEKTRTQLLNKLETLAKRKDAYKIPIGAMQVLVVNATQRKDLVHLRAKIQEVILDTMDTQKRERIESAKVYRAKAKAFIKETL